MKKIMLSILVSASLSAGVNAQDVSKEQWISTMKTALPAHFCQDSQYFRQCFNVTKAECQKEATSATKACLDKLAAKVPAVLNQPKDGSAWGEKLGFCAGSSYAATLAKKRISNTKCNDINNWK